MHLACLLRKYTLLTVREYHIIFARRYNREGGGRQTEREGGGGGLTGEREREKRERSI